MAFQSTMWTVIAQAKQGSREALEQLLARYRPPILRYLVQRGVPEHDAEDVVQEVFLEICEDGFLEKADRSRGRFRSLLLAVTHHVLTSDIRRKTAQKRGGGLRRAALEEVRVDGGEQEKFDREWARHMIGLALERMKNERGKARGPYAEALELRYFEGLGVREIADRLESSPRAVENTLYNARIRLRKHLLDIAREYASTAEELEEDFALLDRSLK
jgi:RNA polymerase sigma factor (sigma-70 family)